MKVSVEQTTLYYAFKFALNRGNFAPLSVLKDIEDNLDNLHPMTISKMLEDISKATYFGEDVSKIEWLKFKEKLVNALK